MRDTPLHFVVGDVHGHADALRRLLDRIGLDAERDRLWLVGDLVNRGPDSPGVLRLARDLAGWMGERFVAVLGNHDVHLLAVAEGLAELRTRDTVQDVLDAPDRDGLLGWLRARPVLHREGDRLLVHAGLLPAWTPEEAEERARRVEERLKDPEGRRLLLPREDPTGIDEEGRGLRRDFQVFVRLRTLTPEGEECDFSGSLDELPADCIPWFRMSGRRSAGIRIFCGHWAALGLHFENRVTALDSGCAWSGSLTALRLDDEQGGDGEVLQVGCGEGASSGIAG